MQGTRSWQVRRPGRATPTLAARTFGDGELAHRAPLLPARRRLLLVALAPALGLGVAVLLALAATAVIVAGAGAAVLLRRLLRRRRLLLQLQRALGLRSMGEAGGGGELTAAPPAVKTHCS